MMMKHRVRREIPSENYEEQRQMPPENYAAHPCQRIRCQLIAEVFVPVRHLLALASFVDEHILSDHLALASPLDSPFRGGDTAQSKVSTP